jgi:uncharacterized protein YcbX
MAQLGVVDSLWRYPVKSMRGEELDEAVAGFAGVYGDRLYAFTSDARPAGFPWLTGREQRALLQYRPRFRHPEQALRPPNLAEAEAIAPGLSPVAATPSALAVEVETPSGDVFAVDDPSLARELGQGRGDEVLSLVRSDRALTDARPISLFSLQSAAQLSDELGFAVDKRRFRANIYLDLAAGPGFSEDAFVGQRLQIGAKVVIHVLERDPRCAMISIDPDTAERNAAVLKQVADEHEGHAGVYGAVLVEGTIRPGDALHLLG